MPFVFIAGFIVGAGLYHINKEANGESPPTN
ncbi:hypothetical protein VCE7224_00676 [Vibrio celticus]|uniref:Uncharacterized protein n=1 Tax=Vibrio celticus TaxID=446372 RepID=A0A1C3J9U4_9VIBR|nr:hypothetical protein VCE7224_00676 [Vibrio celticus]